jgi:hypothetical protein
MIKTGKDAAQILAGTAFIITAALFPGHTVMAIGGGILLIVGLL